ncbi:enolase-phosphatase E1-like [Babylonia areolata]|uniref:enolase-phosphatase E1-like n=1 Tax=Babylonia areolata TaxID=304850 RepID=UPI003FD2EB1C
MMAPQKRSATEAESLLGGIKAIIFDIEGTTTPITFVKDELFPYVRDNVEKYLTDKIEDADTLKDICALRELAQKDKSEGVEGVVEIPEATADKGDIVKAVVENVKWQMDSDRKSSELKQLQGHIWRQAYESGKIKGKVFGDVAPMLRLLCEEGYLLYVYSSGSVEAQKLLFANLPEPEGDITDVFTGYFDTAVGPKTEMESYKKIAEKINKQPEQILFLTDLPEEAEAAVAAGCRSALVMRPGNADLTDEHLQNFACIEQLEELYGDEDDDDIKRQHTNDNGEAEEDDEEEVDEEDEEEGDEEEGEGEDA